MANGRALLFRLLFFVFFFNLVFAQYKLIRPKLLTSSVDHHSRIFGGTPARDGQFPYAVFMLYKLPDGSISRCSASLVALDKVLLAAHCFNGMTNIQANKVFLAAGKASMVDYVIARQETPDSEAVDESSLGIQERRAEEVKIGPQFTECSKVCDHDVALISVANKPFQASTTVGVIPISRVPITGETSCLILGWGFVENNEDNIQLIYGTRINAYPLSECQYKSEGQFYCLKSRATGICQGDSGSPLVCDNQVYGVASHTLSKTNNAQCGEDMEEYFAELATELYWLEPLLASKPSRHVDPSPSGSNADKINFSFLLVSLPIFALTQKSIAY